MAEFDPVPPRDAAETAYREALLGDDTGRDARRARLMAALPLAAPVQVSRATLAWRWQPYALSVLAAGLLVATVFALRSRSIEPPPADPRLAAGQAPASAAAVVVAHADRQAELAPAPVAAQPRAVARVVEAKAPSAKQEPVAVAQAATPRPVQETAPAEAIASAAPPPAAPPVALAAAPPPPPAAIQAEVAAPEVTRRAERAESMAQLRAPAISSSLQASAAPVASGIASSIAANGELLAAASQIDVAAVRTALQVGASVRARDAQGHTALMLAARGGSREVVALLLAAGARKDARDLQGQTAADHAQAQGHAELADTLR